MILGENDLQKHQYSFGFKPLGGKVAHPVVSMSKEYFYSESRSILFLFLEYK